MNERRVALRRTATGALCRGSRVGCDDLDSAGDQPSPGFGLAGTPATTGYARRERGKSDRNRRR
jgi:hypothetical protein